MIGRVIDSLNASKLNDNEAWEPQHYPVATSSTEVIVEATGCVGVCVETWMALTRAPHRYAEGSCAALHEQFGV